MQGIANNRCCSQCNGPIGSHNFIGVCTKNPDCAKLNRRIWDTGHASRSRNSQRTKNSMNRYRKWRSSLLSKQNGLCAFPPCRKPIEVGKGHVDHNPRCHKRWEQAHVAKCDCIRGVVYPGCNTICIAVLDRFRRSGEIVIPPGDLFDYISKGDK